MSSTFQTSIDQGIAELVINQPPVNALDSAGWHALADEIERLAAALEEATAGRIGGIEVVD